MNSPNPPDGPMPKLQFGDAELVDSESHVQGLNCIACTLPIETTYFALGDQVICPSCKEVVSAPPKGSGFVRLAKATCFGTGAGLVGAVIWYLIRVIANLEIGLVAILVGYMVGKAIHKASAGKGGFVYQALAVLITYGCISANYMPDIFQGIMNAAAEQSAKQSAEQSARQSAERLDADEPNTAVPGDEKEMAVESQLPFQEAIRNVDVLIGGDGAVDHRPRIAIRAFDGQKAHIKQKAHKITCRKFHIKIENLRHFHNHFAFF